MSRLIKAFLIIVIAATAFGAHLSLPQKSHSPASVSVSWGTEVYAKDADETSAQTDADKAVKDPKTIEEFIKDVAKTVVYVHRIFYPLNHYFAFQIGNFLGTDYIFEGAMGTMLKNIWIISRNIVNVIFVLILLFLAIRYILPGKDEGGGLRQQLGKFAIILIAVNFSWLASKVVLDAANVVTNVAFGIPSAVNSDVLLKECEVTTDEDRNSITQGMCYPTAIFVSPKGKNQLNIKDAQCDKTKIGRQYDETINKKNSQTPKINGQKYDPNDSSIFCWDTLDLSKFSQQTSTIYLTYGTARIQNLIKTTAVDIDDLTVGTFFSLVLQIAYLFTLIALFLALVIRMAVLWLFVAFSPFLVLLYYLSDFKIDIPGASITEFVKWAFVPAGVGAVFSVAFLMISAGQTISEKTPSFFDGVTKYTSFTYKNYTSESLFAGIGSLQQFIWHIITVGILWVGTFTILSKFKFIEPIAKKIDTMGRGAAYTVGTAPYWAPIIPLYDPKTQKLNWTSAKTEMGKAEKVKEWRSMSPADKVEKNMEHLTKGNAQAIAGNYGMTIETVLKDDNSKEKFKGLLKGDGHKVTEIDSIMKLFVAKKPKTAPAPPLAAAPATPKNKGESSQPAGGEGGEGGEGGGGGGGTPAEGGEAGVS